jgi:hypothetical protein
MTSTSQKVHPRLEEAIEIMQLPKIELEDTSLNRSEPALAALIKSEETPNEAALRRIPDEVLFAPSERTSV